MAHQGSGQAWGKLVKVDSSLGSEILLINRECTVGRKKGALNIITNNVFDHVSYSSLVLLLHRLVCDCLVLPFKFTFFFNPQEDNQSEAVSVCIQ